MGYESDQCPRCFSTEGFSRKTIVGKQLKIDGRHHENIEKKLVVPVCLSCGKWSYRKDIIKRFSGL